jgi:LPS-assembly lipoprotein
VRTLATVLATLVLAACGFHLQSAARLAPRLEPAYVDATDRHSEFYQSLSAALSTSGTSLAASPGQALTVVRVLRDEPSRRVLTVSAANTPREYEVEYLVEYSVSTGGKELLPAQSIVLTRIYSFDETQLLAKEEEESRIRAALAEELAALVMRRLAAL